MSIDPENHSHVVNMDFIEFYGSYPRRVLIAGRSTGKSHYKND